MPGQKAYVSRRVWRLILAADQHAPAQNDKSAFRRGVSFGGKKLPVCRSGFFQNLCLFNEVMYLPLGEGGSPSGESDEGLTGRTQFARKAGDEPSFIAGGKPPGFSLISHRFRGDSFSQEKLYSPSPVCAVRLRDIDGSFP